MHPIRLIALFVMPFALIGGIYLGGHPRLLPGFIRDPLVGDQDTRVVAEAIDEVRDSYYRVVPEDALADAAVKGVVKSLDDRFSNYFTPQEYAEFQMSQNSEFSGIGTTVQPDPLGLRVAQVFDESPAERAGVKVDDLIVSADGRSLKGLAQEAATARVKGPKGTEVKLGLKRGGRELKVTVTRATVSVPQVASKVTGFKGTKYGVVSLAQFGGGAHAEVYQAIRKVIKGGAKGIVFDLRANGGGLVSEAQLVASGFLEDGPIVKTEGRKVPARTLKATGDPVAADVPLVVLVDKNTASASEIVAGALQDRGRAKVVGTKTFGKGVFQEVIQLSNGGALDITAGQYFTPSGRNLGGKGVKTGAGIKPDVAADDDPKTPADEGLRGALRTLAAQGASA
ncbi:MAG: Carboxyl-terminal protease [uncultured Solirubrobacteraceae bacterium]|uniref:Carboxyl-terminal protease n=1 Tax=uncultured Solirubrobacteraceae bacterium TaxID=1162706 RepID=A0A6J4T537_9ACTN|nr:MAG: Carboxyl-terminal protease [uncultured Solirubrobacteraceae bacterium]